MSSKTQTASSIQGDHKANCKSNSNIGYILFILFMLIGVIACVGIYYYVRSIQPPPLTFKVVSLQLAISNNNNNNNNNIPSSDIQKYMSSADVNLTLSLTDKDQDVLIIQPLLVSILYGDDDFLSSIKFDPKDQNTIDLDMSILASHLSVKTLESIATDLALNHSLVFKIHIKGGYCILKSGGKLECDYGVALTCDRVKVNFLPESNSSTRGSLINGPCSCKSMVD